MPAPAFDPELRLARFLPRGAVGLRSLRVARLFGRLSPPGNRHRAETVDLDADVSVRRFQPPSARTPAPALLWIHGGGYVTGTAAQDDGAARRFADTLDVVVASVDYRLAPEHPFPTPLEDCYAALRWLAEQPDVDPTRIAIGGASAGAGLAAALALLARERGEVEPVLQLLAYPMLDDRTVARTDIDERGFRLWNQSSNRFGWASYLGDAAGGDVPHLAAPARADDLSGLPPTWIGIGTLDLFHDENVAYADRLREAGVDCTLHVAPGAYHAFDRVEPRAGVSRDFLDGQLRSLDAALNKTDGEG